MNLTRTLNHDEAIRAWRALRDAGFEPWIRITCERTTPPPTPETTDETTDAPDPA